MFLESGGRPDVIAGDDPAAASGLTQILAETGQNFLGMDVDLEESRRLTAQIARAVERGDAAEADRLRELRQAIDTRFDPEQALAGTVRYLTTARERLGEDDLAVVSYHMGIGNLTSVLRAYAPGSDLSVPELVEDEGLSWARIFFDTAPDRNGEAHALLARLGDDSPTYYWRVLAAQEIMRLYRDDSERLQELDLLHAAKDSAEEALHPPFETERFADATDLQRAWDENVLQPLPDDPVSLGFAVDDTMGELAPRLGQPSDALSRPARRGTGDARLHRHARPGAERGHAATRGHQLRARRRRTRSCSARGTPKRLRATRSTRPDTRSTSAAGTSRAPRRRRSSSCSTTSPRAI